LAGGKGENIGYAVKKLVDHRNVMGMPNPHRLRGEKTKANIQREQGKNTEGGKKITSSLGNHQIKAISNI